MRNREAARYARWAAITALTIALVVAIFYSERAVRAYAARRHGPPPVPAAVEQESADFTYSMSGPAGQTLYTIRASHATRFREGDRALLQDVWVTIYGNKGDRNDNIHTRECSYEQDAGNIQCTGDVDIDIQSANAKPGQAANRAMGQPLGQAIHVKTSNLTFHRASGEASTAAPVQVTFAGGQGSGVGLQYDSAESELVVRKAVQFQMAASPKTGGLPVSATAANLELRRDQRLISLGGPVVVHEGDRELSAQNMAIGLDQQYRVQSVSATGSPVLRGAQNGEKFEVAAEKFEGQLDAAGVLAQLTADGGVNGMRDTAAGRDRFTAGSVRFAMVPGRNLLKEMMATGGVTLESHGESHEGAATRTLKTDSLRIAFAVPAADAKSNSDAKSRGAIDRQHIQSAETLGPATLESATSAEAIELKSARLTADFGDGGNLRTLRGHSGVQITRTPKTGPAQVSTANELVATFAPGGAWETLDEVGNVKLAEGTRQATAAHANVVQSSNAITLDGSPVLSDRTTRISAGSVSINQKTGEIHASHQVTATLLPGAASASGARNGKMPAAPLSLGMGEAHISGDTLSGSTSSGDVTFQGHARLWQGAAVLNADQIQVSQSAGSLVASGHVVAVFPQDAAQGIQLPAAPGRKSGKAGSSSPAQLTWQVRAAKLTYADADGVAHLEGGVTAESDQGTLQSHTLDVYLAPSSSPSRGTGSSTNATLGSGGLDRVLAQGNVTVRQGELRGKAEQAEYQASSGKFVLSGGQGASGQPTITDQDGNTITGHSLTFTLASDTISVDSAEGSRTLTRHRVEK